MRMLVETYETGSATISLWTADLTEHKYQVQQKTDRKWAVLYFSGGVYREIEYVRGEFPFTIMSKVMLILRRRHRSGR